MKMKRSRPFYFLLRMSSQTPTSNTTPATATIIQVDVPPPPVLPPATVPMVTGANFASCAPVAEAAELDALAEISPTIILLSVFHPPQDGQSDDRHHGDHGVIDAARIGPD
jgi:hypothetical protein